MILPIYTYGQPVLRKEAEPLDTPSAEVRQKLEQLSPDMFETLAHADGVGLAAPQVGRNIRMLVMDPDIGEEGSERHPRVLINPELTLGEDMIPSEQEGCLSVPMNYRATVKRASTVHLKATDLDGNSIDEDLEGFAAIVVQHEYDHLDGVLFIDRISRLRRSLYDSKVKKWLKRKSASA